LKQVVQLRDSIEKLRPNQSLALLAVPLCLVEPLKLVAVFVAGKGHWITGTVMITLAYAASLMVVERLFGIVKPKLLQLRWFARIWSWFIVQRRRSTTTSMMMTSLI
jgi:hypothetical protein